MVSFCGGCGAEAPADLRFCRSCGTRLNEAGETDLASRLQALRVEPHAPEALALGHLLLASGMSAEATESFSLAIKDDPYMAEAHLALAVVHLQNSELDQAKPSLLAAIESSESASLSASARAYLAILLLEEYDVAGSDVELRQAEIEDPGNFLVLWKRGEYYFRLGMYLDAERALKAASRVKATSRASAMVVSRLLDASRERAKRSFRREPLLPQWGRALRKRINQARAGGSTA